MIKRWLIKLASMYLSRHGCLFLDYNTRVYIKNCKSPLITKEIAYLFNKGKVDVNIKLIELKEKN